MQSIQTSNVQHRWRNQISNSSAGSGFGVGHLRAREWLNTSELQLSQREYWADHTDSKCPAQMEKSNIQLECRLWVWSWVSARTLICTSALRFRTRMMSKQAVHTNSKFPRQMGTIKSQTRVQTGRIYSVEKLNWMLTYTQWMAGEWSNTYRLRGQRQLPDGHLLECRYATKL